MDTQDKRTAKRRVGDIGEGVACKYLEKRGYRILERNYLKPWGEIDIVAEKGSRLSFIEVKSARLDSASWPRRVTREPLPSQKGKVARESGGAGVRPEENMHPGKLRRLHRAVQTYLLDHKVPESQPWQIDLACVFLDFSARRARVEMFENVIL